MAKTNCVEIPADDGIGAAIVGGGFEDHGIWIVLRESNGASARVWFNQHDALELADAIREATEQQ